MDADAGQNPGAHAASELGVDFREIRYGKVSSVEEAAAARGVSVAAVVKSLLVRRGDDDHLLVLVPGDRSISWPKLRTLLGVSRLSMPDADTAFEVTGYRRGTITPLGLDLPVVVDERLVGESITLGSGEPGVAIGLAADPLIAALSATVADVAD
jgi:prolyl-tRNA editing enzyme YbaK/EbsC (Cys-tRNA(Pro) deacylase)